MIQKRKSDSLLVKLVCLDCRRDNFSSAQGFINHCRIAHGRNFASHDAAADACGEPVDVDEAGAVVGGDGVASASTAGLVHPLIYSAHMLKQETPRKLSDQGSTNENSIVRVSPTNSFRDRTSGHGSNSHVTPSPLTPNLSTLMQRRGANLDLQCLVADMKTPVPLDESSESEGEENDEASVPEAPALGRHPHLTGAMQPVRSTVASTSSIPPAGRKGLNSPPLVQTVSNQSSMTSAQASPPDLVPNPYISATHSNGLEPSPTNESNQAPSLVDDDGDEEYEAHSPSYSGSEGADVEGRDLDFDVEDGDESGPSTRNRSTESEYAGTPKQHPSPTPTRRASALRRSHIGREEKHVSFVSPSPAREPEPEPEQSQKSGDRKRRRTTTGSS